MLDFSWIDKRSAGVFLHISSLPSDTGIGNFADRSFLDYIDKCGFEYWQICPIGPTGYGDSPYQSFSAFAGNPYFIDLDYFVKLGVLNGEDLKELRNLPKDKCDYGRIYENIPKIHRNLSVLAKDYGYENLGFEVSFEDFVEKEASWLEDFALYWALKAEFDSKNWLEWPKEYRDYNKAIKQTLSDEILLEIESIKFIQWVFFQQYNALKKDVNARGIKIFGDIPIFLSLDSADVWKNRDLFDLDKKSAKPINVSGVEPDYFSEEGQLWGNPLYLWKENKLAVYKFWKERIAKALSLYDVIRFDHFRGFADYWQIPTKTMDAKIGKWVDGPGVDFFKYLKKHFPEAKFVAEDLGMLSDKAIKLKDDLNIASMGVLQFAFGGGSKNTYLPHNINKNMVYYGGTHDNDTSLGWYKNTDAKQKDEFRQYFRTSADAPSWDTIHCILTSVADMAILTMQDILSLDSFARFNTPGNPSDNWQWRVQSFELENSLVHNSEYIRNLIDLTGREKNLDYNI